MNYLKYIVGALVVAAIAGAYLFPHAVPSFGNAAAGSTFSSAKVAAININPQNRTSTSTSIYNGDASDRIITDAFVTCTGLTNMFGATDAGVINFQWGAATSSVAAPTNSILNNALSAMNITVATSSADGYTATTTYTSAFARRWAAGSHLIFQTNATSSSASCQAGVHYLAL